MKNGRTPKHATANHGGGGNRNCENCTEKTGGLTGDDALSDARRLSCQVDDMRLGWLIDAWRNLSADVKGEILRLAGMQSEDLEDFNNVVEADALDRVGKSDDAAAQG